MSGTTLGLEIMNEICQQTHVLAEYAKLVATETDTDFVMIKTNLGNFEKLLSERVDSLKRDMDRGFSEIDKVRKM